MIHKNVKYIEWLSADELHAASQEWLSDLKFTRDEHRFFEDLITEYTSLLIKDDHFSNSKALIEELVDSKRKNTILIAAVQTHENELKVMLDGINELKKEEAYTKEHFKLMTVISDFLKTYNRLKKRIFTQIKELKKQDKRSRIIEKE